MTDRTAEVVADLVADRETPRAAVSLRRRGAPLAETAAQRQRLQRAVLADRVAPLEFSDRVEAALGSAALAPAALEIFQVNLGKLCNMTCRHCHVDAGPDRTDAMMSDEVVDAVIAAIGRSDAHTVDLTGGAPELHPRFRDLVDAAVDCGKHIIDRCNLTVLLLKRHAGLIDWLGERGVEIVASLPHYRRPNTDAQRGQGVHDKSLEALRRLNAAGYGRGDPHRRLTLMSNPAGAFLGAAQGSLEREWKEAMRRLHGIEFDRLLVLNNMPIARFLEWLDDSGQVDSYLQRLVDAFNPAAVAGLCAARRCRSAGTGSSTTAISTRCSTSNSPAIADIRDFDQARWRERRIVTARHCYGCTAGAGSSCGGQPRSGTVEPVPSAA